MHYPIITPEQLPAMLRSLRQRAGLTQTQLAERLGISQQSYARLEARPAAASVERLSKLLRALDAELVIRTRDDKPPAVSDEAW
ncbi:helix-turn-helix domain-containing protein [Vogesella indigofera]|uniref:helix-turn-helix domain-containing protein n=1 Tax=Vogesella indigofera TaxID=45465 RepID=UPI00234F7B82|nr:helix-turn-helix transcriptional regulator [Vogesella indigofera]MDC7707595.1 helix-turn-helix transcriptional regulator [Vogesella indigofera]